MSIRNQARDQGIRMDLHVHSKHSSGSSQWLLHQLNCPESFSEPRVIYDRARNKGMDLVTITDHDSLAGSLDIAHLENTFLSEEITAFFPSDECAVHVLALDITEKQHREIQKLRGNIHELTRYLRAEAIFHAAAHPLYAVNHLLTWWHVEQLLLLFQNFEVNGAREHSQNTILQTILQELDQPFMEHLANKHDLSATHSRPWDKNLLGGSDDHSSLNIARLHTFAPQAQNKEQFFQSILSGQSSVLGTPAEPSTMAQNLYGIAYQFYRDRFGLNRVMGKDVLTRFIDSVLTGNGVRDISLKDRWTGRLWSRFMLRRMLGRHRDGWMDSAFSEARDSILRNQGLQQRLRTGADISGLEKELFELVRDVSESVGVRFAVSMVRDLSQARLASVFQSLGSSGTITTLLAPYFLAYSIFSKDREFGRFCIRRFREEKSGRQQPDFVRPAVFTDTFSRSDGEPSTLKNQLRGALDGESPFCILTCGQDSDSREEGLVDFPAVDTFQFPEYPQEELYFPPFLRILDYCSRQEITHIHSLTPGPMGLVALGVAKVLQLPLRATYRAGLPEYIRKRTQDRDMEEMIWKYLLWYLNQMDTVTVPSVNTARQLLRRGLSADKVRTAAYSSDAEILRTAEKNDFRTRYFDHAAEASTPL